MTNSRFQDAAIGWPHGSGRSQAQAEVGVQPGRRHDGAVAARHCGRPRVYRDLDRSRLFTRRRHRLHALGISSRQGRSPIGRDRRRSQRHSGHLLRRHGRQHLCAQRANRRADLEGSASGSFRHMATATPRYYKGVIYQPFSSFEEAMGPDPKFGCCTFRGSVVALDAAPARRFGRALPFRRPRSQRARIPRGLSSSDLRARPYGRRRPSMSNSACCTSPPETTIPIRLPTPATRSWRWNSRPASCCGPSN